MPDTKITALTAIGANPIIPATFPIPMVDLTDTSMAASGTTKKVTVNQILGAGGTATLASATITGDLTVGNGTSATQTFSGVTNILDIGFGSLRGGSAYGDVRLWTDRFRIYNNAGTQIIKNISGTNGDETWYDGAGGTRMTLNASGLGVGGSPTSKLSIFAGVDGDVGLFRGGSTRQLQIGTSANAGYLNTDNTSAGFELRTNGTARAYFDNSGNVGIGVAPSAKLHVEGTGPQARFSIASASDARHEYYRNGIREGLLFWDANVIGLYATQSSGEVVIASANTIRARVKAGGQVRFVPLASDPASAEAGDVYYNSSSNKLKCYNGSTWNDLF